MGLKSSVGVGLIGVLLAGQGCVSSGRTGFAARPSASIEDDRVEIRFTLAGPTDYAVFIRARAGRTVRHLAAGAASAAVRKSWAAFWKANRGKYEWPEDGPPLRPGS